MFKKSLIVLLFYLGTVAGQFSFLFDREPKVRDHFSHWRPFWSWNWNWNPLKNKEYIHSPPPPSPSATDLCVDNPSTMRSPSFCSNQVDCSSEEGLFECKKTCNLCHIRCTDLDSTQICSRNLALNKCSQRDVAIRCENTCGLCQVSSTCADTMRPTRSSTYCNDNKEQCHTQSMRQECAKTCQVCTDTSTTPSIISLTQPPDLEGKTIL